MKNKIRIGSAVFIVIAIMMAATLLGPALNNLNTEDDGYEVNSITVENEFTEYLGKIKTEIAGIAEHTSEGYHVESAGRILGYDDSELPITFTYNPEDGSVKGSEEFMEMFDRIEQYDAVFDENGNMTDVVLIVDGEKLSLSEYFDPVNECIFPVLIAAAWFAIAATAVVTVTVVVVWIYIDENGNEIKLDPIIEIFDWLKIGFYATGAVVMIKGIQYALEKLTKSRPDDNNYYFAFLFGGEVNIIPVPISIQEACAIMLLPERENKNGPISVFTYYAKNAYKIAELATIALTAKVPTLVGLPPYGPEVHGGGVAAGFMYHYHTAKHTTPAHAFFEEKLRS